MPSSNIPFRKATALLLAAVVFLLGLAAVSQDIHGKLHANDGCHSETSGSSEHHHDSTEGHDHYCAVTILQFGAIWTLSPIILGAVAGTINYAVEAPELSTLLLLALPGNRGPPIVDIA